MKKTKLSVMACLLAGSLVCSSCIGSFSLFNQYASWQREMTDNKYINAIIGFVLMPIAGSITLFVDSVVLNTIEFWSGENPVADNGRTQKVMGEDGNLYAIKTIRNGYKITAPDGQVTYVKYDKANDSWYLSQNGKQRELFRFNKDGKSIKVNANGQQVDFALSDQGVDMARMYAGQDLLSAQR